MRHRRSGMSLVELIVTIGIMSFVIMGAFQVFNEGMQLFRTNQRAVEAQASALKLLTSINLELTNANKALVGDLEFAGSLPGVIFASPIGEDGDMQFHEITGRVYWRKVICFYFVKSEGKVYRREILIPNDPDDKKAQGTTKLGAVKTLISTETTDTFAAASDRTTRLLASDISGFSITKYSGNLTGPGGPGGSTGPKGGSDPVTSYDVAIEAGDKDDRGPSGFYIKVDSRVSPRG